MAREEIIVRFEGGNTDTKPDNKSDKETKKQTAILSKTEKNLLKLVGATYYLAKSSPALTGQLKLIDKTLKITLNPIANNIAYQLRPLTFALYKESVLFNKNMNLLIKNQPKPPEKVEETLGEIEEKKNEESTKIIKDSLDNGNIIDNLIKLQDLVDLKFMNLPVGEKTNQFEKGLQAIPPLQILKVLGAGGKLDFLREFEIMGSNLGQIFQPLKSLVRGLDAIGLYFGDVETFEKNADLFSGKAPLSNELINLGAEEIFNVLFKNIDTPEIAKFALEETKNYLTDFLGDAKDAEDIALRAYGMWLGRVYSNPVKPNQDLSKKLQEVKDLFIYGEAGALPSDVSGQLTDLSNDINVKMTDIFNNEANKTVEETEEAIKSVVKDLENFRITLGEESLTPFAGIMNYIKSANNVSVNPETLKRINWEAREKLFGLQLPGESINAGKVIKPNPQDNSLASKGNIGTTISTMNVNITIQDLSSDIQLKTLAERVYDAIHRQLTYGVSG